jgi:dynein light chain LC8-type
VNLSRDFTQAEFQVATFIKEELQKFDSPTYHVIIGKDFGCNVTTELNKYLCFKLGLNTVLVFKAG